MAHKLNQEFLEKDLTKIELLEALKNQNKNINLLEKEYTKYKNWFENSMDGFYRSSLEGHFIDINLSLVKMLGYNSKEELLQVNIKSQIYLNSDERETVIKQNENDSRKVHSIRKKDGSKIWVKDYGRTIIDENGNALYYEGIIRNVTDFKRTIDLQKVLLKISQVGHNIDDFKDYNRFIIKQLGKLMDVSNSYIAFYNKAKQTINIPFIKGEESEEEFPVGKSMTGYLIKGNKTLMVKAKEYRELMKSGTINLIGTFPEVWLGVPLKIDGKPIGGIVVQSYTNENAYDQKDVELLEFVSSYISSAIQGSRQRLELKKFSLAVEQSGNTIVITDVNGDIEYVNSKFIASTGYTKEEAIGVNPRILNSGNQPKEYYASMWKTISSGKEWLGEFQNKSKNGKLYWERVAISAIKNGEGIITNYMAIKEDITVQKTTEAKLMKANSDVILAKEVLRKVLDNIPTKVFWKDLDSKFLGVNAASIKEKHFVDENEVIGKSDFDFYDKKWAQKYRNDELEIMQSGVPKLNYIETQVVNGKELLYKSSKLPLYDAKNNVMGIVGTSEDITEKIEYEEKLKKATEEAINANLSKSTFLANMSHEIRTPMNAILGYSQLLQEDNNLTKDQQESLRTINKSGEHLLALINDILDMSKIEAGRIDLNLADFDFIELLKEIEQLFKNRAASKNLTLDFKVGLSVPKILLADESKIKQVIINLIGNAIKFTDNGYVKVIVETINNQLLKVEVKDSGCGIAVDDQQTIFKPFEQAKKGGEVIGGTGLGLAISKKFSNLMNGDITIESEPNKGASFIFTFEFQQGNSIKTLDEVKSRKVVSLVPEMQGIKVAIVDDRFENRDILFKKLHPLGFKIKMAENGLEAVELYENWKPDIVLMDVVMPVMNGVEATRRILEIANGKHDVKVFVVSASALESEQRKVMEIGATVFIKKPVIFDNLIYELENKGNLKFIFKEEKKNSIVENIETDPSDIPLLLKVKFIEAASKGDFLLLQELLVQLEKNTSRSFKYLENCIEELEFEELINWLKS